MRVFIIGLLLSSLMGAAGQVTVEVVQEQQQFLQGESIPVAVRITNRSGQTLHLGEPDDWLVFDIEERDGPIVAKTGFVPVSGAFELPSSQVATKRADLAPYFAPMKPGQYLITATVTITEWNRQIASPAKAFNVIEGAKIWEQEVGIPSESSSGGPPEMRRYMLQQANYLKSQLRLYLRVTDSYGKTYSVVPIGPVVSFGRPEAQVDKFSHLHVLYQDGPSRFGYTVYDFNGNLLGRHGYDYGTTRPKLRMDEDGIVFVLGGVRRYAKTDVPPPPEEGLAPASNTNEITDPYMPQEKPSKKKKKSKTKSSS